MRLWRVLVLLAGASGVVGFFAPFVDYRSDGRLTGDASAFQIARGVDNAEAILERAERLGLPHEIGRRIGRELHQAANAYRGEIIAYFAPAALLLVLGIGLVLRDRMGRLAGLCAVVLGAACCAVFGVFWRADQAGHDANASLGLGLYLLLAAGIGGALGGLGGVVNPDRGV